MTLLGVYGVHNKYGASDSALLTLCALEMMMIMMIFDLKNGIRTNHVNFILLHIVTACCIHTNMLFRDFAIK